MTVHRKMIPTLVFGVLLAGAGCNRGDGSIAAAEADEPNYRTGQLLVRQGNWQEALVAYQKVIAKRGDSAPESHLEAGNISFQNLKDSWAAIYHFREYLRLQPNSRQAPLVRQQIQAAMRELARSLPMQPDQAGARFERSEQVERLQREIEALRSENASLRAGAAGAAGPTRVVRAFPQIESAAAEPPAQRPQIVLAPLTEAPIALAPAPALPPPNRPTTSKSGRIYKLEPKDTLSGIVRKFHGSYSNAKLGEILEANRDVLPNGEKTVLKPGMELRIP